MTVRRGFTLLELMIALAGAILLAGVVLAVYNVILRATGEQEEWRQKVYPIGSSLELLAQDLAGAAVPWGITNPPLSWEQAPNQFRLGLLTVLPDGASGDFRAYTLASVCWRLTNSPGSSNTLMREQSLFRFADNEKNIATTNLWRNVGKLQLEFWTETGWNSQWNAPTNTRSPAQLPGAVRIKWQSPCAAHRLETDVFVPASQTIMVSNMPGKTGP